MASAARCAVLVRTRWPPLPHAADFWHKQKLGTPSGASQTHTQQPHSKALTGLKPRTFYLRRRPRDREPAPYRALHCNSFPGTSMMSQGSCEEPHCQKCEDDEYQDRFTKESKCLPQTFCDESKSGAATPPGLPCWVLTFNLSPTLPQTGTFRSPSTTSPNEPPARAKTASTAPPPSVSPVCRTRPANRDTEWNRRVSDGVLSASASASASARSAPMSLAVVAAGHHLQDTVCEKCSEGTFSENTSRTEVCRKWTEWVHVATATVALWAAAVGSSWR